MQQVIEFMDQIEKKKKQYYESMCDFQYGLETSIANISIDMVG